MTKKNKQANLNERGHRAEHGGGREESLSVRGIQLSISANTFHLWILHWKSQTRDCNFEWRIISISPSQVICLDAPDSHLTERLPTLPQDPLLGPLYFHHYQERFVLFLWTSPGNLCCLDSFVIRTCNFSINCSRSLTCESGGKIIPFIVSACMWRLFTHPLCC